MGENFFQKDKILYEALVENALLRAVKNVLKDAEQNGLRGNHFFYITFKTAFHGVTLSKRLQDAYPDEMTIVLQHEFSDLTVEEDAFFVRLSFGNIPETIRVPFNALVSFSDPHAQFAVGFHAQDVAPEEPEAVQEPETKEEIPAVSGNVISLGAFRKKK